MIRALTCLFKPRPTPAQRRAQALAEYEAAKARKDTRRLHAATEALRRATTEQLRAEVGL